MSRRDEDLGLLEQQVMFACIRLNPNAYGVSIGDEIMLRTGKQYAPGSIYAAIERLENRGYLKRRRGEATAVRGGRAKDYFTVTGHGRNALHSAEQAIAAMRPDFGVLGVA